jgi:spore coat protein CotH
MRLSIHFIHTVLLALNLLCSILVGAQDDFYDADHLPEIKIYFSEDNWDEILDQYFIDGDEQRLLCDITVDGVVLDSVGIRYKGYSSASVDRPKNPFNIKLDYVIGNQSYQGKDKIKLSNVIQDPSFVREVLSYEIARKYMPASRSNFGLVYINDVFWGVYTNVESVDKEFLNDHFNTIDNTFFKCNPTTVNLFGENSNLSDSPGPLEEDYYDLYSLESDDGWSNLLSMIEVLNNEPEDLESELNIDRALWMHAFNYALINFDSYVGYAQNYYIYQDENGQFNTLPWDLNMSFASYRFSDASEFYDGFSIEEAQTMDPLLHLNSVSVFPRPLMRKLFENDTHRRMYLAHMRTIMEENFNNQWYAERAQFYQDLIDVHVLADTNKFYSYDDFIDNLTSTVFDFIDYPGITELMDARSEFLATYPGFPNAPTIDNLAYSPGGISTGSDMLFTAEISNADDVWMYYRYGGSGLFENVAMVDDGTNGDVAAGDGIYSATLSNMGNGIDYYFYAENEDAGRFSPERAAYQFYELDSPVAPGELVINEFMPYNVDHVADPSGDFDDWIELYNNTSTTLSTAGLYVSDDPANPLKWAMPDLSIAPGTFPIIWADEQGSEGAMHANFQLAFMGEFISLANADGSIIDSTSFGQTAQNQSLARFPNGTGPFVEMNATFAAVNEPLSVQEITLPQFSLFPNPASRTITIRQESNSSSLLTICNAQGGLMMSTTLLSQMQQLDVSGLAPGMYFVTLTQNGLPSTKKLIVTN